MIILQQRNLRKVKSLSQDLAASKRSSAGILNSYARYMYTISVMLPRCSLALSYQFHVFNESALP